MEKTNSLKIENISFKFEKDNNYFFENISLKFDPQNINFITGPNGSGKSTFFRILQGTIEKSEQVSGRCFLNNKKYELKNYIDVKNLSKHVKTVRQDANLMIADKFSSYQNLKFSNFSQKPTLGFLAKKIVVPKFISQFNIDLDKPVHLLSGGQKQILAILMALQKNTNILLLDEPTASLDIKNTIIVMDFLKKLVADINTTVLIICHNRKIIDKYAKKYFFEIKINKKRDFIRVSFHAK